MARYAEDSGQLGRQMYRGAGGGNRGRYNLEYNTGYDESYRRAQAGGYGGDSRDERRGTYHAPGYDASFTDQLRGGWDRVSRGVRHAIGRGRYDRGW